VGPAGTAFAQPSEESFCWQAAVLGGGRWGKEGGISPVGVIADTISNISDGKDPSEKEEGRKSHLEPPGEPNKQLLQAKTDLKNRFFCGRTGGGRGLQKLGKRGAGIIS